MKWWMEFMEKFKHVNNPINFKNLMHLQGRTARPRFKQRGYWMKYTYLWSYLSVLVCMPYNLLCIWQYIWLLCNGRHSGAASPIASPQLHRLEFGIVIRAGVFLHRAQCSLHRLWIYRNPEQDKVVPEN